MRQLDVSERDWDFFRRSSILAQNGEHRVRVGALACVKGTPISGSWNTIRNSAPVAFSDMTSHAEINCLMMVPLELLSRTTLYIARVNRNGDLMDSMPCSRCMESVWMDIKAICFFLNDGLHKYRLAKGDVWNQ